jgi:hypothetical protein
MATDHPTPIAEFLRQLKETSVVAHREVEQVLPAIEAHGPQVTLAWLDACRRLFDFDREAGKAFIRGSREVEKISETVLPWTEQALMFLRWRGSWRALEGFMTNLPRAFGSLGHAGERRWAEIGFGWCARQIESGGAYFATPVLDLAGRQGVIGIEQLSTPAEELFESRKLLLGTYLAAIRCPLVRGRSCRGARRRYHAIGACARRGVFPAGVGGESRAFARAPAGLPADRSQPAAGDADRRLVRHRLRTEGVELVAGEGRPFVKWTALALFPAVMPGRDEAYRRAAQRKPCASVPDRAAMRNVRCGQH